MALITDPFKSSCITKVSLVATKLISSKDYVYGIVEFKNGNTTGSQKFEAEKLCDLFFMIKNFVEKL